MKAQDFFGGKNAKPTGVPSRVVGQSSATPGVNNTVNNHRQLRDNLAGSAPQADPRHASAGGGNNSQQVRNGNTSKFVRPNIPGKVDNRRIGK